MIRMLPLALFLGATEPSSLRFSGVPSDSIEAILTDNDSYTSRSTRAIVAQTRSGAKDTLLFDAEGRLSPLSLGVSKDKAWFAIANPYWIHGQGICEGLLCAVDSGVCRCNEVVSDSGFYFGGFIDSLGGGCKLLESPSSGTKVGKRKKKKPQRRFLTREQMEHRFFGDSIATRKIR